MIKQSGQKTDPSKDMDKEYRNFYRYLKRQKENGIGWKDMHYMILKFQKNECQDTKYLLKGL